MGKHILIVDDEHEIRFGIALTLKKSGHIISEAANGLEALELVTGHAPPDLIILDLQMPVMSGAEFMDALRQQHLSIPVIVMTGSADLRSGHARQTRGCIARLDKPFSPSELKVLVDAVLEVRSLAKAAPGNNPLGLTPQIPAGHMRTETE